LFLSVSACSDNTNQQKDRQHKSTKRQTTQINKKTDNTNQQKDIDIQNTTQKTKKDRSTRIPLKQAVNSFSPQG
jgi:Flp pilus assembly protein TadD